MCMIYQWLFLINGESLQWQDKADQLIDVVSTMDPCKGTTKKVTSLVNKFVPTKNAKVDMNEVSYGAVKSTKSMAMLKVDESKNTLFNEMDRAAIVSNNCVVNEAHGINPKSQVKVHVGSENYLKDNDVI